MDKNLKSSFRVPRKTNRQILELITEDGDQKQFLLTKLMESFKKPDISKSSMQFTHCWSIKNPESEAVYMKKRQSFKLKGQNMMEFYGFLYLKSENDLNHSAKLGKLKVGNVPSSKLASGKMGVSLSQFSDIFHPGTSNYNVPTSGILLIVKYMRGKVNYVTYDENPMEPQPLFDCHIVRNGNNLDANATINKAFHSTQIFLYEYDEDADIVDYPSQLLIIGAAKFNWSKKYIFRTASDKPIIVPKVAIKRTLPESFKYGEPVPRKISCISTFSKLSKPKDTNEPVPIMCGNLIVMDTSSEIKINVTITSKFKEPVPLHNLMVPAWELTEVIQNHTFIEFFHYMDDKGSPSIIKVSPDQVTQLPPKFYDGKIVPRDNRSKHLVCLSMIPNSFGDKKNMTKLIDHMSTSETVGRITTNFFPNILFFLFPSGKISENLGIPKEDGTSLHILLLYSIHPEIGCTNVLYRDEYTFIAQTNTYTHQQESPPKHLIALDTIKQAALSQFTCLTELYSKMTTKALPLNPPKPKSLTHDNESDMDVDSDTETNQTKRRNSKPQNDAPSLKSPNENKKPGAAPVNNSCKYPVIPIRTPTTLPDTICFDSPSFNWKQISSPSLDSADNHRTPVLDNVAHKSVNSETVPAKSSQNNEPNTHDPNRTSSIPTNLPQNQSRPQQQHPHPLLHQIPLPDEPSNHVETTVQITHQNQSKSSVYNHQQPLPVSGHNGQSDSVSLLDHEIVPRPPNGHFKLISMTRQNNFVQRRGVVRRPIKLPNLELMTDVVFVSTYKG